MKEEHILENTQLIERNEALMAELFNLKSKPRGRIGYLFIAIGAILFAISIDYSSFIIAFLSIALLFWGGLFLYIKPTNFVRQEVLLSNLLDTYSFYNKLIESTDYRGNPQYISPKTISNFRDVYIFIPKNNDDVIYYNDLNSPGTSSKPIQINPIGLGIAKLIEEETKQNFSTINIDRQLELIKKVLIEDLELVKEFESNIDGPIIRIKMVESIFDSIYEKIKGNEKSGYTDYLSSVIACSLAMSTHKPISIEKMSREKNKVTLAEFRIH
jgi:hypothetical protein